jgi:hypothetical protein
VKAAESSVLIFLWSILSRALAQEIPSGFNLERYNKIWERNTFYAVKPAGPGTAALCTAKARVEAQV